MNSLKFYPLFIGGFFLAIGGGIGLLFSTMYFGPFITLGFAFAPCIGLWYVGFSMLKAAERY